jgi:hypothetical protein
MSAHTKLNILFAKLIEAVRSITGKEKCKLCLYEGYIQVETINITEKDILGQAITNTPDTIQLVAEIELKREIDFLPSEPIDPLIYSKIKPLINSIRYYINYLLNIINKNI